MVVIALLWAPGPPLPLNLNSSELDLCTACFVRKTTLGGGTVNPQSYGTQHIDGLGPNTLQASRRPTRLRRRPQRGGAELLSLGEQLFADGHRVVLDGRWRHAR
eukprot:scaffold7576_cov61-Phaeocystis_antarctica.AAC.6